MDKRYFTTTKTGEEVEVDQNTAKELVRLGKKQVGDFEIEDISESSEQIIEPKETKITDLPLSTIGNLALETGKYVSKNVFIEPTKKLAKGFVRGATFGTMGQEEPDEMEGSVMEDPNKKFLRRVGKAGEFAGAVVPLVAAEMTGGAALAGGAAVRGAGTFGKAVASGLGTGLTYEATKGAAKKQMPTETIEDMALGGSTFAGLSIGGQALGYMRKLFGEKLSESIANHFINTNSKVAEKLLEQGKPSLGKQALEEVPQVFNFKNRKEAFDITNNELGRLENQIQGKLDRHLEMIKTPNIPTVGTRRLGLPYSPTKTEVLQPSSAILPSGRTINLPASMGIPEPKVGTIPTGIKEPMAESMQTSPRLFKKGGAKGVFRPEEQAIEKQQAGYVKEAKSEWTKRFKEEQNRKKYGFSMPREGTVEINNIAKNLDDLEKSYRTGTRIGEVAKIRRIKESFINNNPRVMDLNDAMILKRRLDEKVSKSYLQLEGAKIPISTEADEILANNLRKRIYEIDPEIGKLAAAESLLIRMKTGLLPVTAQKGGSRLPYGFWATIVNAIEGSPVAGYSAKALDNVVAKRKEWIPYISRQAARYYSSENPIIKK